MNVIDVGTPPDGLSNDWTTTDLLICLQQETKLFYHLNFHVLVINGHWKSILVA